MPTTKAKPAGIQHEQLWRRYKRRPSDALRNQLAEIYLLQVTLAAQRLWSRLPGTIELADLVQAGALGLMNAIEAFDLRRKVRFETFCQLRIRGAMLDWLRDQDWVPRKVRSNVSKLNAAREACEAELGRPAHESDLARHLGQPLAAAGKLLRESRVIAVGNLESRLADTHWFEEATLCDLLADPRQECPVRPRQLADLRRLVCKGLNRNERLIILLYYFEQQTMKQIAGTLNLSESRVSQMHSQLMIRLRWLLEGRREEFAA